MNAVREKIKNEFEDRYLPAKPIRYAAGKNAQEAHEAIRPTDLAFTPDRLKGTLSHDQFRLLSTDHATLGSCASQMAPPVFMVTERLAASRRACGYSDSAQGRVEVRRPIPGASDARRASKKTNSFRILDRRAPLDLNSLDATQHFTQRPAALQ